MRIPRLYSSVPLAPDAEVVLDPVAAQHAVAVLRLGVGAEVALFDGRGGEHPATLASISKSGAKLAVGVRVGALRAIERELPFPVVIGQALAKGERMDLVVQKATELGASMLVPLVTERSEVKLDAERAAKRIAHWQGIVRSACKQCGRNRLMEVVAPLTLDGWLSAASAAHGTARWVLAADGTPLARSSAPGSDGIALLVGPEGGLSDAEVARAESAGFVRVSLGPRVLRTETASLAALAGIQALWGEA